MSDHPQLFYVYNRPPEDRLPNKEKIRVDEAARCLGCSRSHVFNLIEDGTLDASNIARAGTSKPLYRVFTASVRQFIESRREGAH